MNRVRRLWDQWRHPGELPTQREYRRWRAFLEATTPSHGPYVLSSVREVTDRTELAGFDKWLAANGWHREWDTTPMVPVRFAHDEPLGIVDQVTLDDDGVTLSWHRE